MKYWVWAFGVEVLTFSGGLAEARVQEVSFKMGMMVHGVSKLEIPASAFLYLGFPVSAQGP